MRIMRVERIKEPLHKSRGPAWLISFTDLIMLMLAYFILLYAVSQPSEKPWKEASESIRMRFGGDQSMTVVTGNPGANDANNAWKSENSDPGLDLRYLFSLLQKQVSANPALKDVVLAPGKDAVIIALPVTTTFEPGNDRLSATGDEMIKQLTPILIRLPNKIEVTGHADSNMINSDGRFGSNWHLSLARASAVTASLQRYGYKDGLLTSGRGTEDMDLLPKNLPDNVRNEMARRVDLRLRLVSP